MSLDIEMTHDFHEWNFFTDLLSIRFIDMVRKVEVSASTLRSTWHFRYDERKDSEFHTPYIVISIELWF